MFSSTEQSWAEIDRNPVGDGSFLKLAEEEQKETEREPGERGQQQLLACFTGLGGGCNGS